MISDLSKDGAIGTYTWEDRDLVDLKPAGGFFRNKPSVKWAVFEKDNDSAQPQPPTNLARGSVKLDDALADGEITFGTHKGVPFSAVGTAVQSTITMGHLQGTGTTDETYHVNILRPDKTLLDTCTVFVPVTATSVADAIVQALTDNSKWGAGSSPVTAEAHGKDSDAEVSVTLKSEVAAGAASNDFWAVQPVTDGQLWGWDDASERGNLFKGGSGGGTRTAQDIADEIATQAADYLSEAKVSGSRIEFTAKEEGVEDTIAVTGTMFSDPQGMSL